MAYPRVIPHSNNIYQIDADYIAEGIACIYLIREGDRLAIIDTGTTHTVPHLLKVISTLGLGPEHLDWVILTHIHLDHAGGAGEIMSHCPNARLAVHPRGASHMVDPQKLEQGTIAVYGEAAYRKLYRQLIPVDEKRVVCVQESDTLDLNGRALKFIDTPGHALHHVCICDTQSGAVFSGDTFGLSYRFFDTEKGEPFLFVTTTPTHFDPIAMKESIHRIADMCTHQVFLTHYGGVEPSQENVNQLLKSVDAFVDIAEGALTSETPEKAIEASIMQWLLNELKHIGFKGDETIAAERLAADSRLNAQGLCAWLQRVGKIG